MQGSTKIVPVYCSSFQNQDEQILTRLNIVRDINIESLISFKRILFDREFRKKESDKIITDLQDIISKTETTLDYECDVRFNFFGQYGRDKNQPTDRIKSVWFIPKNTSLGFGEIFLVENYNKKEKLVPRQIKIEYGFYKNASLKHLITMYEAIDSFNPEN
ncbi:hypothetical protein HYV79_01605 [Candidatus Woesearchaeota archaeon]|nr:hypothetical protein [Candidatus Woesearchaeota archaeon]